MTGALEGKAKEAWGKVTGDESTEVEGKAQEAWGKTERKAGEATEEAKEVVKSRNQ
ncbi:MAG: CsbD family protein [Ardenticatenaceae bacterium]|nr:CsbD family protein [Ardenticatenaceae bacterium]